MYFLYDIFHTVVIDPELGCWSRTETEKGRRVFQQAQRARGKELKDRFCLLDTSAWYLRLRSDNKDKRKYHIYMC